MKQWTVRIVPVSELEQTLCALEWEFSGAPPGPIITFIDQTRVVVSFPHFGGRQG